MVNSSGKRKDARRNERGNALVYVLIAIALFAALSFTLMRNTDSGEAGALPAERAELYASQLISYAVQAKSVYDQMEFQGARIDQIDFVTPADTTNFNAGSNIRKIFHPEGGGLNVGTLTKDAASTSGITPASDPAPGWYMGRFNNIEWTPSAGTDIILTAYGIDPVICGLINQKINGSTEIPTITAPLKEVFVQQQIPFGTGTQNNYSSGSNRDLTTTGATPICAACDEKAALCVQQGGIYAFYNIIAHR